MRPASLDAIFDSIFVEPPMANEDEGPSLPAGWRPSPVVAWLAVQPRERRETILALGFGLLALALAPLGIVAVLSGHFAALLVGVALVAAVVAAPRPSGKLSVPAPLRAMFERGRARLVSS